MKRLLAIASGGGHWIELMRLEPIFSDYDTVFVSMFENYRTSVKDRRCYVIPDASRFRLSTFLPIFWLALRILMRERPHAVITTGSAPMLPILLLARLFGARTLWIDSIANPEVLSTSGRIAKRIVHRCVAQWPEVARREGLECWGAVL
jgi:UDP-N-acetylglucosamine:LPS N-acetylglucosamine transferase